MRSVHRFIALVTLLGALALIGPAGAAACSAGDSQYIDPLNNNCGTHSHHTSHPAGGSNSSSNSTSSGSSNTSSSSSNPSSTVAAAGTSAATSATTSSSTATTASGAAKDPKTGKTLPYTGLDLGPALIVALVLLGGGFTLRRVAGDPR